jgi:hypothetical protein
MLFSPDFLITLILVLVELFIVGLTVFQGSYPRFWFLSLYFLFAALLGVGWWLAPFTSDSFQEIYPNFYLTNALLTIFLVLAIAELMANVFGLKPILSKAIILLVGTALACLVLQIWTPENLRPVLGFTEVLFLVSFLAALFLFSWKFFNPSKDRVASRIVNPVLIYCSLVSAIYALRHLFPGGYEARGASAIAAAWLAFGCAFALLDKNRSRAQSSAS